MKKEIVKNRLDLSIPCEKIVDIDGEGMSLTDHLFEVLDAEGGIGLAANQIGTLKQAFVCLIPVKEEGILSYEGHRYINPEILERKSPFVFNNEGCLSFPKDSVKTLRFGEIFVRDSLRPNGVRLFGLEAVVVAHEVEHLEGKTFHDSDFTKMQVNQKCLCRSGKKYKRCCKNKVSSESVFKVSLGSE